MEMTMPLAHLRDFNWEWQQEVQDALSKTTDWTPESSYEFLQFLASTSQHWCAVVWNDRTSQDCHDFGHFLMGLIDEFKEEAEYSLKYPNTRSADEWKQEYFGWWKGTVRLANEILMEWNVSVSVCSLIPRTTHMQNTSGRTNSGKGRGEYGG